VSSIDPNTARTAEDYVMLLRQVRAISELSYWQIEERAREAGFELEPSLLVETLGLADLPDEQLVTAMLHACGHGDEVDDWLAVRSRLAAMQADQKPDLQPDLRPDLRPDQDPSSAQTLVTPLAAVPDTPAEPIATLSSPRPRHTLRVPGKGSRRAPHNRLAVLGVAAGLAILAVTSIAVIVSAVRDDDGSARPPVYAPGMPTATDGYTLPASTTPTGQPSAEPTPTAAASPSVTPSASPLPPGVARSGTVSLQNGQGLDFDTGATTGSGLDLIVYGNGDSLRADPNDRHFALISSPSKQACAASGDYQKTLQGLTAGNSVCVRTDRGAYAAITISRTNPLVFSYVVWS
jgi:hypothetical protein